MMPVTRVAPETTSAPPGEICLRGGDVRVELGERRGEVVPAAAVVARNVVQVRHACRMGGRLNAGEPRTADRPGRQANVLAGVVGRVDPQVGFGEVRLPVPDRVLDGR